MRALFWTVVTVCLAVSVAFLIDRFPGNVLIVVDQWRLQVSLAFAILLTIAAFASLYALIRVLTWLVHMPQRYRGWRGQRRDKREQSLLEQGWTALLEGRYTQAEKTLTSLSAKSTDKRRQVLALLSAARAAHEIGEFKRQDELLGQALTTAAGQASDVELNTAVAAAAADLWLQQGRAEEALGALQVDRVQPMRHLHTMRLMLKVYQQTNNHAKVLELTRTLRRKDAISPQEAKKLIETSAAAWITELAGGNGVTRPITDPITDTSGPSKGSGQQQTAWQSAWKELNSEEKTLPDVALAAAQAFQQARDFKEATKVLEVAITRQDRSAKDSSAGQGRQATREPAGLIAPLNPRLLAAYARAEPEQVTPRLQKAEQWLEQRKAAIKENPEVAAPHADLLTTLGALCLAAQMWGQAQRYLEQSAKLRKDARVHALLGSLFDRLGQPQRAAQHWRLATAVSAALPTLAQDVVLPAANTAADPVIAHIEGLDVYEGESAPQATTAPNVGTPKPTDYDEFFDSAPIPMGHFESVDEQRDAMAREEVK